MVSRQRCFKVATAILTRFVSPRIPPENACSADPSWTVFDLPRFAEARRRCGTQKKLNSLGPGIVDKGACNNWPPSRWGGYRIAGNHEVSTSWPICFSLIAANWEPIPSRWYAERCALLPHRAGSSRFA
jgi:hypothetical protein